MLNNFNEEMQRRFASSKMAAKRAELPIPRKLGKTMWGINLLRPLDFLCPPSAAIPKMCVRGSNHRSPSTLTSQGKRGCWFDTLLVMILLEQTSRKPGAQGIT